MIPLYSKTLFNTSKSNDLLPLKCKCCNNTFSKRKELIKRFLNKTTHKTFDFCSIQCQKKFEGNFKHFKCKKCNIDFKKTNAEIKKSKNHFCSKSCSTTYNNTHKNTGTRRSKLETYLEQQLISLYPNLAIDFNKKDTINSELDIYIPSLKLAFELNGIYHYEPIHGTDKLNQIQNNDHRKFQACAERNISLCIIDTSKQKYFKESTSQEFLNIIIDIINNISKN